MQTRRLIIERVPLFVSMVIPVVLVTTAAATSFSAQGEDDDVIRACTRQVGVRKEITMLVIADSCEPGWTPLEWNVQGPPGPTGPQGNPGDSHWLMSGSATYYNQGNVGIGTANPRNRLHVQSTGLSASVYGINTMDAGAAVGVRGDSTGRGAGVVGESNSGIGVLAITNSGDIFVGRAPGAFTKVRIDNNGKGFFNGGTQTGGADFAESMRTTDNPATLAPGDVLVIDPENLFAVRKSQEAVSQLVVGVYSGKPAVLAIGDHDIDDSLYGEVPVAIVGIVPTKVTAENGPIRVGDLLVTSPILGHAMKAQPVVIDGMEIYPTGAILGKALEPLETGTGMIKILLMLQ